MNTLVLRVTTRILLALILVFSVFMLLRGHNQPGGGFVGGLVASIGFSLYMFVAGPQALRRVLRTDPRRISSAGLGIAIVSGLLGSIAASGPFMTSTWAAVQGTKIGTPLLFDVGVYLVVVGAVLTFVLAIMEQK